mgnify:CR=1 FL=1
MTVNPAKYITLIPIVLVLLHPFILAALYVNDQHICCHKSGTFYNLAQLLFFGGGFLAPIIELIYLYKSYYPERTATPLFLLFISWFFYVGLLLLGLPFLHLFHLVIYFLAGMAALFIFYPDYDR